MKRVSLILGMLLASVWSAGQAQAFAWTCGDESYVRLDVLDTPTSTQVGMLYGDSLENGHWLGDSAIALQCGSGGSSGATLLVCRTMSDKSGLMLTIFRDEDTFAKAYVTAPTGHGDVSFDMPCH